MAEKEATKKQQEVISEPIKEETVAKADYDKIVDEYNNLVVAFNKLLREFNDLHLKVLFHEDSK